MVFHCLPLCMPENIQLSRCSSQLLGAITSIVDRLGVFSVRIIDTLHTPHVNLISPFSFRNPATLCPQFGQNQLKGLNSYLFAISYCLLFFPARNFTHPIDEDPYRVRLNVCHIAYLRIAMLADHPSVRLVQIKSRVHRAADRALHVILLCHRS